MGAASQGTEPAARVEIGVRFEPRGVDGAAPAAGIVASLPRAAQRAEAEGLDAVWLGEEWPGSATGLPAALPLCAALGAATRRIRIGTALVPLPLHHPLRVAEDAATVDQLSSGRLELGLGLGADPAGLADFGLDEADRAGRFEEALALLRMAWGPEPLAFRGRYFQVQGVSVHPKPLQAGGPPVWVGALAPAAQARAARGGAGLLLPLGAAARPYLEACAASGVPPRTAWIAPAESLRAADAEGAAQAVAGSLRRLPAGGGRVQVILGVTLGAEGRGARPDLDRVFAVASRLRAALA